MRAPLTPIEHELYQFLLDFLAARTFQPSVREIAAQLKIPSTKSVTDLLASLERKGYVEREAGRSRGIMLVGFAGAAGTVPVPVMRVASGRTDLKIENYLTLDRKIIPSDDTFLIRVTDKDAPTLSVVAGDLAIVHPSERAREGGVVVARVGDVVLVRTLHRRGAGVVLNARIAGGDRELGPGDNYTVLGVLAGVIRAGSREVPTL